MLFGIEIVVRRTPVRALLGMALFLTVSSTPIANAQSPSCNTSKDSQSTITVPYVPKPGYLTPVTEATFQGLVTRIAGDSAALFAPCSAPPCNWKGQVRHTYSTIQPWNSTGTLLAIDNGNIGSLSGPGPAHLLLDGVTYAPMSNSNYPYPGLYDYRWHPSVVYPSIQINVNAAGSELKWVDVTTGLTVSGRSWTFPAGSTDLIGLGKGNPSDDARWIALGRTTEDTATHHWTTHVFAVDMLLGRIGDLGWTLPDCNLAPNNGCKVGSFSISPDGHYLVVKYADQGVQENEECIRVFDFNQESLAFTPHPMTTPVACGRRYSDSGLPLANDGWVHPLKHADMTILGGGVPVLIGINTCRNPSPDDLGRVRRVRLDTGEVLTLSPPKAFATHPYADEAFAMHVSCRNTGRPGWCFVSYDRAQVPGTKRFDNEIVALSTDGQGLVERFAHLHSDNASSRYRTEPQAVPSPDGYRVLWASNWCWNSTTPCASLTEAKPYVLDATCASGCPLLDAWTASGWHAENSLLARSPTSALGTDSYRLKSSPQLVNGRYRLRIHEDEQEVSTLDQVRLGYVDHAANLRAFALGERVVLATRTPPYRVTTQSGRDITALVSGTPNRFFVGEPGDTLLVELMDPDSSTAPAVIPAGGEGLDPVEIDPGGGKDGMGSGLVTSAFAAGSPVTNRDEAILNSTGLLIQGRDASGTWTTVRRKYPRQEFDEFLVDTLDHGPLRVVFVGRHKLRFIGRVLPVGETLTPRNLPLITASQSRLEDVRTALLDADGSTTTLESGDTLALEFASVPPAPGLVRDLFIIANGAYRSVSASAESRAASVPTDPGFTLLQNQPNPFRSDTHIQFELPTGAMVRLEIFDAQGRRVVVLANRYFMAGSHSVPWNRRADSGEEVRPGVYLYRVIAGRNRDQRTLTLLP